MKRILPALLTLCLAAGCKSGGEEKLLIATASNVQFVMEELAEAFTEESGVGVEIIYGSSGKLTAQIMEGAPFDVFVSADMEYPEELQRQGLTTASPEVYAYGSLVLWTMEEGFSLNLDMLATPAARHIAIPNPKNAPYGDAAVQVLKYYGLYPLVKEKLVFGESITHTSQFILSRTATIGFTSRSVVVSPKLKNKGKWTAIPEESYSPIRQGVVVLKKEDKNVEDSEAFYTFLFSDKAQNILLNHGYNSHLLHE